MSEFGLKLAAQLGLIYRGKNDIIEYNYNLLRYLPKEIYFPYGPNKNSYEFSFEIQTYWNEPIIFHMQKVITENQVNQSEGDYGLAEKKLFETTSGRAR